MVIRWNKISGGGNPSFQHEWWRRYKDMPLKKHLWRLGKIGDWEDGWKITFGRKLKCVGSSRQTYINILNILKLVGVHISFLGGGSHEDIGFGRSLNWFVDWVGIITVFTIVSTSQKRIFLNQGWNCAHAKLHKNSQLYSRVNNYAEIHRLLHANRW